MDLIVPCIGIRLTSHRRSPTTTRTASTWMRGILSSYLTHQPNRCSASGRTHSITGAKLGRSDLEHSANLSVCSLEGPSKLCSDSPDLQTAPKVRRCCNDRLSRHR